MSNKVLASYAAICFGVVLILIGATFAVLYVRDGVIATIGEADRSPIFWYLPILFIGIVAAGAGVALAGWGTTRLRKKGE